MSRCLLCLPFKLKYLSLYSHHLCKKTDVVVCAGSQKQEHARSKKANQASQIGNGQTQQEILSQNIGWRAIEEET